MKTIGSVRRMATGMILALVCVTSMAMSASTGGTGENAQTEEWVKAAGEVIDVLAALQSRGRSADPNKLKNLYAALSIARPPVIEENLTFYRCEVLARMDKRDEAMKTAKAQLDGTLGQPDLLPFLKTGSADREASRRVDDELGRLLPLSLWGSSRDHNRSPAYGFIDPTPPRIPRPFVVLSNSDQEAVSAMKPGQHDLQSVLAAIGELYEKAGFTTDALNTYLEAVYALTLPDDPRMVGQLWLKIGGIEKNRGNARLALRAYLRAVYVWNEYAEQAKQGAMGALKGDLPPDKPTQAPKLRKDVAVPIAALYAKLNLHPMGLAVLIRCEKDTGADLAGEKTRVLDEWKKVLSRLPWEEGEDYYVLGQKASEVKDWATMSIPRPMDTFWK
jgi:hypothetical protein